MKNYYDYAASTPTSEAVISEMKPWIQNNFANPSSNHKKGQEALKAIENARIIIANKISAMPSEIVFTSGASEANNFAIKGIAFKHLLNKGHIITSKIEHKCVLNTCAYLESIGFRITYLSPDKNGVINPFDVQKSISNKTILVSIHHVNNELGTIQPIDKIGHICFDLGIPFHTDAAQSFCKLNINVDDMDIDMLSLSGHKIYGPKGVGALYIRDARSSGIVPLIHGGGQENGFRGGTSPTPLIVGLGAAVTHFPVISSETVERLIRLLSKYKYHRNGGKKVLSTILNITFEDSEEEKRFLQGNDWLVSQGSACNSMSNVSSHVLSAIGLSEEKARRTYRISLPS